VCTTLPLWWRRVLAMLVVVVLAVGRVEGAGAGGGVGGDEHRAVLETVLYNPVQNGGYVTQSYKLVGAFSPSGTAVAAEGRIIQVSDVISVCNLRQRCVCVCVCVCVSVCVCVLPSCMSIAANV
jgi:hypothetical protein